MLVPSVGSYTIIIEGEGSGVYTHSLTTLKNEVEAVHHTYTASVTPTSVVEYTKTNNTYSNISVEQYKKKGLITKAQYREVDKIINKLIEN